MSGESGQSLFSPLLLRECLICRQPPNMQEAPVNKMNQAPVLPEVREGGFSLLPRHAALRFLGVPHCARLRLGVQQMPPPQAGTPLSHRNLLAEALTGGSLAPACIPPGPALSLPQGSLLALIFSEPDLCPQLSPPALHYLGLLVASLAEGPAAAAAVPTAGGGSARSLRLPPPPPLGPPLRDPGS